VCSSDLFNTQSINTSWTNGITSFTCNTTGLYQVSLSLQYKGSSDANGAMIIRLTNNNIEILGSQSCVNIVINTIDLITESILVNFVANDLLRCQVAVNDSLITLAPNSFNSIIGLPQSVTPTSAKLTIIRLK